MATKSQLVEWLKNQRQYAEGFESWPSTRGPWEEFVLPYHGRPPLKLRLEYDGHVLPDQEDLFLLQIPLRKAAQHGRLDIIDFIFIDLGVNVLHYGWISSLPSFAMDHQQWDVVKHFREMWDFDPIKADEVNEYYGSDTVMEEQCFWAHRYRENEDLTPLIKILTDYTMDL